MQLDHTQTDVCSWSTPVCYQSTLQMWSFCYLIALHACWFDLWVKKKYVVQLQFIGILT